MYLSTEWEGRMGKIIFGSRSGHTDRTQWGLCLLTESQIYFPSRPDSLSQIINILSYDHFFVSFFIFLVEWGHTGAIHIFPVLSLTRTALIWDLISYVFQGNFSQGCACHMIIHHTHDQMPTWEITKSKNCSKRKGSVYNYPFKSLVWKLVDNFSLQLGELA